VGVLLGLPLAVKLNIPAFATLMVVEILLQVLYLMLIMAVIAVATILVAVTTVVTFITIKIRMV
jgi:hypothetical protein